MSILVFVVAPFSGVSGSFFLDFLAPTFPLEYQGPLHFWHPTTTKWALITTNFHHGKQSKRSLVRRCSGPTLGFDLSSGGNHLYCSCKKIFLLTVIRPADRCRRRGFEQRAADIFVTFLARGFFWPSQAMVSWFSKVFFASLAEAHGLSRGSGAG